MFKDNWCNYFRKVFISGHETKRAITSLFTKYHTLKNPQKAALWHSLQFELMQTDAVEQAGVYWSCDAADLSFVRVSSEDNRTAEVF